MSQEKGKAIILMSGGLDSLTCLAIAQSEAFRCHCISFDYGQRHLAELKAANAITAAYGVEQHITVKLPLHQFVHSALTNPNDDIPEFSDSLDIPTTYVPARNTIFLAISLGWAETLGATDIFFGGNAADFNSYPDCRPEYFQAYEQLMNLATKSGVEGNQFKIHTPLQHLTKADIIKLGNKLGVDYSLSVTCYDANEQGLACGVCGSCHLRRQGFIDAGTDDTTRYQT